MTLLSYRCMKRIFQGVGLAAWDVSREGTAKRTPQRPPGILLNSKRPACDVWTKCGWLRKMAFVRTFICVHEGESWTHRIR